MTSRSEDEALDRSTIEKLRVQLGEATLDRILETYLDEMPTYLARLRAGIDNGDAEAVVRAAHSLKGASRLIGGEAIGTACERIENLAKGASLDGLDTEVESLERLSTAIRAALMNRLGG